MSFRCVASLVCDGCQDVFEQQIELGDSILVLRHDPELCRARAAAAGWVTDSIGDYCPACVEKLTARRTNHVQ